MMSMFKYSWLTSRWAGFGAHCTYAPMSVTSQQPASSLHPVNGLHFTFGYIAPSCLGCIICVKGEISFTKSHFWYSVPQDLSALLCEVCVLVFSVTDRRSFHRTAQLRLLLRETQPQTPIILVGNKSDLVRTREVTFQGKLCRSFH